MEAIHGNHGNQHMVRHPTLGIRTLKVPLSTSQSQRELTDHPRLQALQVRDQIELVSAWPDC